MLISTMPSESAAANRMPIAVSSLTVPWREKSPMPAATSTAATRAPASRFDADQVGDGDARQDGVRQGVAQEGHAAQHHVAAQHRTHHADGERREQGALHEGQREGLGQPVHRASSVTVRLRRRAPSAISAPPSRVPRGVAVPVVDPVADVPRAALVDHDHALEEERLAAEGRRDVLFGVKTSAGGPKATSRPFSSATSSKRCEATCMSWVDTRTVMPRAAQALEQLEESLARAHVDAGEGLVEQQHVRLLRQGAGEEDALLLPARELADGPSPRDR